jgi:hypothetical protein
LESEKAWHFLLAFCLYYVCRWYILLCHTHISYVNIDKREKERERERERETGKIITMRSKGCQYVIQCHMFLHYLYSLRAKKKILLLFFLIEKPGIQSIDIFWVYTCVLFICVAIDYKRIGGIRTKLWFNIGRMWTVSHRFVVIVAARIFANEIKLAAAAMMFYRQARRIFVVASIILHLHLDRFTSRTYY